MNETTKRRAGTTAVWGTRGGLATGILVLLSGQDKTRDEVRELKSDVRVLTFRIEQSEKWRAAAVADTNYHFAGNFGMQLSIPKTKETVQ